MIYGPVFESDYNPNSSRKVALFLNEHKDATEIDVRINSPGGSASAGMAIYNSLKNHKATINVYIDGMAASTASLIAMAGDKILINSCAQFLLHNPSNFVYGDEHALRKEADNLKKLKESVMTAYLTKVKISKEELILVLDEETTYTSEEALECGLATHIVEETIRDGIVMYSEPFKTQDLEKYIESYKNSSKLEKIPSQDGKETNVMTLTMEKVKNENPALFNEILEVGKGEERVRLQALDTINTPGSEELVKKAKYETMQSKADVCLAIVDSGLMAAPVVAETNTEDQVGILLAGKKPLPSESDTVLLNTGTDLETQIATGNRMAELYAKRR